MNWFVESNFYPTGLILLIVFILTVISCFSRHAGKFFPFAFFSLLLYVVNKNGIIISLIIIAMWTGVLVKIFNTNGFSAKYSQMTEWYTWPLWLILFTIIISMAVGANMTYTFYIGKVVYIKTRIIAEPIFMFGLFSCIAFSGILIFIKYGLCGFISIKTEEKCAVLRKIWKEKQKTRRLYQYNIEKYYILFENDPYPYQIKKSLFNKLEAKSGVLFSYTKYNSLLDIKYIKNLHEEELSNGNA
jgi:hypothetical protein